MGKPGPHIGKWQGPLIILQSKILHTFSTRKYVLIPRLSMLINQYNSLFLAFSHNFISPHFCIKYLKMPTMISVQITQTQEENDNPTMAHPVLETYLDPPQIPKQFLQRTLVFEKTEVAAPVPAPGFIWVPDHMRGNTKVQGYKKYTTPAKSHCNKKKDKTNNSKKKTAGKAKHDAYAKLDDSYKNKEDALFARSIDFQQKSNLARGIKD
jgi:hypothetical protein